MTIRQGKPLPSLPEWPGKGYNFPMQGTEPFETEGQEVMLRTQSSYTRNKIIAAVVALALIVAAFAAFMNANHDRIVEQNSVYIEGSTSQTARRMSDILDEATSHVRSVAFTYGDTMQSADDLPRSLAGYTDGTNFDDFVFVAADGSQVSATGSADFSGELSVQQMTDGASEASGAVVVLHPDTDEDDSLLVFYSPLVYEGKTLGMFLGTMGSGHLSDLLTTSFFGVKTNTFLCLGSGTVIARASDFTHKVEDVLSLYADSSNDISYDQMAEAFAQGRPVTFSYQSSDGTGSAHACAIEGYNLVLMRTFPEAVTTRMIQNANSAGVLLLAVISVAFLVIIALQLVQYRGQKKTLLLENKQATRIIDASTQLFRRFALIDLDEGTYEYLKSDRTGITLPPRGSFSDFRSYWEQCGFDPEDREAISQTLDGPALKGQLAGDVDFLHSEYRIRNHANPNEPVWVQSSIIPLTRNQDGGVSSVLFAEQDVTDVKELEQEIREQLKTAYRTAEASSKAKTNFLNSMSHDIRTPMNSIMGLTAIGSMHVNEPERVSDCFSKISIASRHLLGLINEVLDMARIESGNIKLSEEDFSLAESVDSLLTIVGPQAEAKELELSVSIGSSVKHENVVGDSMRLQQVLVNIMGNSVKFTDPGGSVSLVISEKHSARPGFGCYEFLFSDTGCGMSPEFLEHIFEPFTRARDNRVTNTEGTGLGMTIVKSVVELMDGNIDVHSTEGVGTTFVITVYLKLRDDDTGDLSVFEGMRMLVADDEEAARMTAVEMLTDLGITAEAVSSGDEAVDVLSRDCDFAAVVLDWKMPGKSGIETARELRRLIPDSLPIIVLSAYDFSAIEQEARNAGVNAFISKPLFKSRLVRVLRELFDCSESTEDSALDVLRSSDYSGRRVLLVEDNLIAASIGQEILETARLEVEHAANGQLAVNMVRDHPAGYYDIVFMDIQMPIMNGYEATRAIRAMAGEGRPDLTSLPIVALSADAFADDVTRSRAAGMDDHMAKPMQLDELLKTLGEWLR